MKENNILHDVVYYDYDEKLFPFRDMITNLFELDSLENIHNLMDEIDNELFTKETDSHTILHKKFYKHLNSGWREFEEIYVDFIKTLMTDVYNLDSIIYQAKPTFRVHLPNNIAVGGTKENLPDRYGWHRDSDLGYNHPIDEVNFIVPLTNSKNNASVYIETSPDSDKFVPADMKVGQFFKFKGSKCIHGNKRNNTGKSRVSIDFRVISPSDYNEVYSKTTGLSGQKFVIGGYYAKLKNDRSI